MKVEANIPDQEIIDALIGAFEGGSNYWYNMPDLVMVPKIEGKYISERIIMAALDGAEIPVYDIEEDEDSDPLGYISKENIKRGVELYLRDYGRIQADEMDAGDSDTLLQLIVMGEVVYG